LVVHYRIEDETLRNNLGEHFNGKYDCENLPGGVKCRIVRRSGKVREPSLPGEGTTIVVILSGNNINFCIS
jgi:hypothetical protein